MFDLSVLQIPHLKKIFFAQFLSQIGEKVVLIVVTWKLAETQSAAMVSYALALGSLPHILFFYPAGRYVQIWGYGKTIFRMDILRAILFLTLALLSIYLPTFLDQNNLFYFLTISIFSSNVFGVFFNTSLLALPKVMAGSDQGRLQKISALLDSTFSLSLVLGAALSVFVYKLFSLVDVFLINSVSHLVAAYFEKGLLLLEKNNDVPIKETKDNESKNSKAEGIPFGFKEFIKDRQFIKILGCFFLLNLALTPIFIFMPLFSRDFYHADFTALSKLELGFALGSLLGATFLTIYDWHHDLFKKNLITSLAVAVFYNLFCWKSGLMSGVLLLTLLGSALAMANINLLNWFQMRATPESLGFVMSSINFIVTAATPVSMFILGFFLVEKKVALGSVLTSESNVVEVARHCAAFLLIATCALLFWLRKNTSEKAAHG